LDSLEVDDPDAPSLPAALNAPPDLADTSGAGDDDPGLRSGSERFLERAYSSSLRYSPTSRVKRKVSTNVNM
jgi:hypothetical protein